MIKITIEAETMFELRTIMQGLGGELPAVNPTYLGQIKDHQPAASLAPSDVETPRETAKRTSKPKATKEAPQATPAAEVENAPVEITDDHIRNLARTASLDAEIGRDKVLEVFNSIQPGATKVTDLPQEKRMDVVYALNNLLKKEAF